MSHKMLLFLSSPASQIFQRGREIVFLSFFIARRELERNLGWVATAGSEPHLEYTRGTCIHVLMDVHTHGHTHIHTAPGIGWEKDGNKQCTSGVCCCF